MGAVPLTRNGLKNPKVRHEATSDDPLGDQIADVQTQHEQNVDAARAAGLNADVFRATLPPRGCMTAPSPRGKRARLCRRR